MMFIDGSYLHNCNCVFEVFGKEIKTNSVDGKRTVFREGLQWYSLIIF
jgi:hypothetical protein